MDSIGGVARAPAPWRAQRSTPEANEGPRSGRALVAVAPAGANERLNDETRRPAATFLAHLIATSQRAPQTRVGRRAPPDEAAAAYDAASAVPLPLGRRLRRSA